MGVELPFGGGGARERLPVRALWSGLLGLACVGAFLVALLTAQGSAEGSDELLLKVHMAAHEPYSPPSNMYLWWGDTTNHRFVGSGEHIRNLLHMGNIEGGEWRDPMFLGNNGVATFRSQRFRRISESCCSTIVMPPFEWDFPVYNTHKVIGQRVRNFVANGNMLVLTGGIMAIEFINTYFYYNIELVDGNYSPGPFRRLPQVPEALEKTPKVLPQKGIAVTTVKKTSLPSGTQVLWGTPRSSAIFMIKFCEAQSPDQGMPPVKVLPRDCAESKKCGRPCSCGHIMYIGYNYQEQYPTRYDTVLRQAVEILNPLNAKPKAVSRQRPPAANARKATSTRKRGGKKRRGRGAEAPSSTLVMMHRQADTDTPDGIREDEEDPGMNAREIVPDDSVGVREKGKIEELHQNEDRISKMESMIKRLQKERRAVHDFTQDKAHTLSLAQITAEANDVEREIGTLQGRS